MANPAQGWLAGTELGNRFSDVRMLRAGSRFTLYTGTDPASGRDVVVKVPDEARGDWLREVLDHEADVLTLLAAHPNVIKLYDRIRLDDGRPALVLMRCDSTLQDGLASGRRIAVHSAVATGIKLAGALESAHHHGIVHCDVRPANVFVTASGEPMLGGFDESVAMTARDRAPSNVTTGHTAPELLEGGTPTARSDVYGLASTLYELIAGQAAFRAYAGESPAAVIVRVLSGRVQPLVGEDIPLELSDLIMWAMSADPVKRPPTPAWLAEGLARVQTAQGWPRTHIVTI